MKFHREAAGVGAKRLERIDDLRAGEGIHPVDPRVASGHIDEQEGISKPTKRETVTVHDIKVYLIEVPSTLFDGFASRRLNDGGEVANGVWKGSCIEELCVGGGRSHMFLVFEPATSKDSVEVKRFEGGAVLTGSRHGTGRDVGDGREVGVKFRDKAARERFFGGGE